MKYGISAEWVGANAGGPERYTMELIAALAQIAPQEDISIYHCASAPPDWLRALPAGWKQRQVGQTRRSAIPLGLPLELARRPVDLCHATYVMPPLTPGRFVVSILDVGFEIYRDHFPWAIRQRLSILTSWGARRAAHIITISEDAKRGIMKYYGVPPERITVTPLAAGESFNVTATAQDAAIRAGYRLPSEYILYVGKIQARKNIPRLLQAYAQVRKARRDAPPLVLVGDRTWKSELTFETLEQLELENQVIFTGHTLDEHLPAIYRGALMFVYPSLLEGFGLPPLEAMHSGVPVACSNATSLPEVVGDAAVLFDPLSVEDIVEALIGLLDDPTLRADLIQRGSRRARCFSWEATARTTLAAYQRALEGN